MRMPQNMSCTAIRYLGTPDLTNRFRDYLLKNKTGFWKSRLFVWDGEGANNRSWRNNKVAQTKIAALHYDGYANAIENRTWFSYF